MTAVGIKQKHDYEHIKSIFSDKKPHCFFSKDYRQFTIKIASTLDEIIETLQLRHNMFFEGTSNGIDFDIYDLKADHLIVKDNDKDMIIGTYRIISSEVADSFYSESEFKMDFIHDLKGLKLEVGRACVHPEFRGGIGVNLLWQGLGAYMRLANPKWFFGCSSIPTTDLEETSNLNNYLLENYLSPKQWQASPMEKMPWDFSSSKMDEDKKPAVPALLKAYLKIGAYVCGEPCWDPDFKVLDYLTLVEVDKIPENYLKRFGVF